MMTSSWLAPALRRSLATLVTVVAAHAGAFRALQARPELPPAGVGRMEVVTMEGARPVTDRATIDRILAVVRAHRGEWTRFPDTVCLIGSPGVSFYEGAVYRGSITWSAHAIVLNTRQGASTRMLSARDAAEFQRLLTK